MRNKSTLIAGILAGMASPGVIGSTVHIERLQGSDLGRLRGDVTRVGRDFSTVIDRERGNKKSKTQSERQPS